MAREAPHALQQADVALLNQVEQVGPDAPVLHGDLDDEAQVRENQLLGGLRILVVVSQDGELALLVARQQGVLAHLSEVARERVLWDEAGLLRGRVPNDRDPQPGLVG